MSRSPLPSGNRMAVSLALLWNLFGLGAVLIDMSLSAADLAKLPEAQQALHAARPMWSVYGSLLAVTAGSLGCALLWLGRRAAVPVLAASLVGIVLQDLGLFGATEQVPALETSVWVLQGCVLAIGVCLLVYARRAQQQGLLR